MLIILLIDIHLNKDTLLQLMRHYMGVLYIVIMMMVSVSFNCYYNIYNIYYNLFEYEFDKIQRQ